MVCLIVSAGSSSLGIPIMVGVAVELAWLRRWRAGWIVIVPAFLYAAWYLTNGESEITRNSLINAPGFAEDLAAAAFGSLIGRGLEWGRPIALVGVVIVLRRLVRPRPVSARLAGLLATGLVLWAVTAAARSTISTPETSRYLYLGAVVIVLTGVELLREVTITARATALATLVVAFCAITGLTVLHAGASGLRATSKVVTAELGALELAAAYVPPDYKPDPQRAPDIVAGPYLHTVRAIGSSPADTPAAIIASDSGVRTLVDENLVKLEHGALEPVSGGMRPSKSLPLVANVGGSQPSTRSAFAGPRQRWVQTHTPSSCCHLRGLLIRATDQAAQVVAVRRFSAPLGGVALGVVAPRQAAVVKFPVDASGRPVVRPPVQWDARRGLRCRLMSCPVARARQHTGCQRLCRARLDLAVAAVVLLLLSRTSRVHDEWVYRRLGQPSLADVDAVAGNKRDRPPEPVSKRRTARRLLSEFHVLWRDPVRGRRLPHGPDRCPCRGLCGDDSPVVRRFVRRDPLGCATGRRHGPRVASARDNRGDRGVLLVACIRPGIVAGAGGDLDDSSDSCLWSEDRSSRRESRPDSAPCCIDLHLVRQPQPHVCSWDGVSCCDRGLPLDCAGR